MERRLFPDSGYYLDNGASVCEEHHLLCEMTILSCEEVRERCGIEHYIVPPHLYADQPYDKWGNPVLGDGTRARGELFFDPSVQKILAAGGVLDLFSEKVKYPRTHHLPFSPGITKDDRVLRDLSYFDGEEVVVTEKLDGENTTMYSNFIHARSLDPRPHPSQEWVKNLHGKVCGDIPPAWRVCGENLYAKHTIHYKKLRSLFATFSIWNSTNTCLSWRETAEWCRLLDLDWTPVLYCGPMLTEKELATRWKGSSLEWRGRSPIASSRRV